MLHILGTSHAISVLKAIRRDDGVSHDNWNVQLESPLWNERPLPSQWRDLPFDALKVFLIRPAMRWAVRLTKGESGYVIAADPGYWRLLETMGPQKATDALISFIGGNDHSVMSLLEASDPYDFRLPGDQDVPLILGRQPVEVKFVAAELERRMNPTIAMLAAIRHRHPALSIWHVMPPPPIASERHIRENPEIFRDAIDKYGITPLSVRMKVYRLYCRLLAKHLAGMSVTAIDPPAAAKDSLGALREDLSLGCTHGNEAYGAMVASQLRAALC